MANAYDPSAEEQGSTQGQNDDDIAAGMYDARGILGSEQLGYTKEGTEQAVIDLELLDLGRQVSTILYFSDNAAKFSFERLSALGSPGAPNWFEGINKNIVKAIVKYETYEGKRRMKVEIYTGQGRLVLKDTMSDEQKRGFFARLNKLAEGEAAPAPQRTQKAANHAPPPADWDRAPQGVPKVQL